jgi:hypothetical protein
MLKGYLDGLNKIEEYAEKVAVDGLPSSYSESS